MDLGSPEEEESPPLMKWWETRAEEAWTWLGLHGVEDREESFLAATLNIFFELRLASSIKPVPTAFAQWDVKKNTRQRKEKKRIRLQKGAKLIGVYWREKKNLGRATTLEEDKRLWGRGRLGEKKRHIYMMLLLGF